MSGVIDLGARKHQPDAATESGRESELAYVIVADTQAPRIAACLAALKPFNVGVLVAGNGDEVLSLVRRFGPPKLLIIDLSLPPKGGVVVIETLRSIGLGHIGIIGWSALRELREFAAHRLGGLNVRVLGGAVAPAVLRHAIEHSVRSRAIAQSNDPPMPAADHENHNMAELAARARELCRTAGVAVYLKPAGEAQFRTIVTWESDGPIPYTPDDLPPVFQSILETGEALVLPDLSGAVEDVPVLRLREGLRGLAAVPILGAEQLIVGMLCVFDVRPFTFDTAEVDALKALGRGVPVDVVTARASATAAAEPSRGPEFSVSHVGVSAEVTDPPTALLDRRGGDLAIARELARVRREQHPLSVILFDVEFLSRDGGEARNGLGPDLLVSVAGTLTGAMRASDLAIHWNSEELLVVLPGLGVTEAHPVAERLRAALQAGAKHPVAVSGGVAELSAGDTFESVIARANQQVQLARARGHNRVA